MKDILEEIVAWKRVEVEQMKAALPMRELELQVEWMHSTQKDIPSMSRALRQSDTGIIAEMKRRSPSKGWINEQARAGEVPLGYERHGAAAVSILTDDRFFGGSDAFVCEARQSGLSLPVLYKNFVVDPYQVLQARCCGASAVLLIAACLSLEECRALMGLAHDVGMEVLLEMHDEHELDYVALEPDMCGINNRHLGTFVTDVGTSLQMARLLPADACKVSESGISHPDTVRQLRAEGFQGFLIGECFMRTDDPPAALGEFIGQLKSGASS